MSIPMYLTVILVTALCVFVLWRISVKQKREYDIWSMPIGNWRNGIRSFVRSGTTISTSFT